MIRTYKYIPSSQNKLHEFVMSFFDKIENETGEYSSSLFERDFYEKVLSHHPSILESKFRAIFERTRKWEQFKRTEFIKNVRESNKIKEICEGTATPTSLGQVDEEIRTDIADLFEALYEKILKKSDYFKKEYGTLLQHFRIFKVPPNNFVKCPACGIRDVETIYDDERDQYDHYLAKSIYPFSSVNFYNLVPICQKCNSLDVKSDFDVVTYNGFSFFPYDANHKGIAINVKILNDDIDVDKIIYGFEYANPDGNVKQIETWKAAFKIDTRHKNFVRGRMGKWYRSFYAFMNDKDLSHLSEEDRKLCCFKFLEKDESVELSFIRKPALESFVNQSVLAQAQEEIKLYKLYS